MVTCIAWLNTQAATRLLQQSVPNRDDPKIDQWIQIIWCSTTLWWIEKVYFIVNVYLKQKRATHITIDSISIILLYVMASPITTILNRKHWTLMVHFKKFMGFGAVNYCTTITTDKYQVNINWPLPPNSLKNFGIFTLSIPFCKVTKNTVRLRPSCASSFTGKASLFLNPSIKTLGIQTDVVIFVIVMKDQFNIVSHIK